MEVVHNKTKEKFHVPDAVGRSMIADGTATAYVRPKVTPNPNAQWSVREGAVVGSVLYPPFIMVFCKTCGQKMTVEGERSARDSKFIHCKIQEEIPNFVRVEYLRKRSDYQKWAKSN